MKNLREIIDQLPGGTIRFNDIYELLIVAQQNFEDPFHPIEEVMALARDRSDPKRLPAYLHNLRCSIILNPKIKKLLSLYD
ncbi:hypothetical protein J4427_02965 [Candidatus Woesearchaeota archaeon]|nr:hypothetical protein [Candidatus Woesearchaeota archaeon]